MAGRLSTAAISAPGIRILIVSALPDAVKSPEPGKIAKEPSRRIERGWLPVRWTPQSSQKGGPRQKKAPALWGCLFSRLTFSSKQSLQSRCRLMLRRRRRLLAFSSVAARPEFSTLHQREGWIRGEERCGGRLSDVGQLVIRRPKPWIGVRLLQ